MFESEIVVGRESDDYLGTAILKFPRGHPALADAYAVWHANRHIDRWGFTGPQTMTRLAVAHGLEGYVVAASQIYPILWDEARMFLNPAAFLDVKQRLADNPFLHIWLSGLQKLGVGRDNIPPCGSFLRALVDVHAELIGI